MTELPRTFKVVRTDRELEMPQVDARLREAGAQLVLLFVLEGIPYPALVFAPGSAAARQAMLA